MNNLLELIKVDLRETLDVRKFKENQTKSISFLAFIFLMGLLFLFVSVIYNLMISAMMYEFDINLINSTVIMGVVATMMTLFTSIFKVKSIFVGKNYDLLRSMPIKKTDIVLSKIINLYLVELLYSAVILVPNFIINLIFTANFMYVPIGILLVLLIPGLPMIIACIASLFISLVADRFKFGNLITFIFYILLFVGIFALSFFLNSTESDEEMAKNLIALSNNIIWANPLMWFIKESFISGNYLYSLAFVGINVVVIAAAVWFIAAMFDKVHTLITSYRSDIKYVRKKLESKGQLKALFLLELKRFFSSKLYFINCISSGISAIIMGVFTAYMFSPYANNEGIEEMLPFIREYAYCGILLITFGIGIATPASCAISIEGNTFWMLKCYPIDIKKSMIAKLLVSILILSVFSLIASIVMIVFIQPTIFASIILIIGPILYIVLASIIGLLINLIYPKINWKNEKEVFKNSASVVLSMFIDWGLTLILAAVCVLLSFVNSYLAGILTIVVLLIMCLISYKILINISENKIRNIE